MSTSRLCTMDDLDRSVLAGATVLVRVDFNVPVDADRVTDDTRMTAALPTLNELLERGSRLVLASHRGRPKGVADPALSLAPVAAHLEGLLDRKVVFSAEIVGSKAEETLAALPPGSVCVLENLRFDPGEKANDPEFAAGLARLAEVYVNDAFGTAHRAHASVVGVARLLAHRAAGRLLAREVEVLGRLLESPERPFVTVAGGAKIEGKMDTLVNLLPRLDTLVFGGGMANTFLAARGLDLAASLVEEDRLELAREILARARDHEVDVLLPEDLVVTDSLESPTRVETCAADQVPQATLAVDIGPATGQRIAAAVASARTVFWNGPLGVFERPPFDAGTTALARALAASGALTVVGGGETVAAARQAGVLAELERAGHVSTGGGAALELLAGRSLPGVEALQTDRNRKPQEAG